MSERDVVPFGPACKDLFLCDEAVVVSSSTVFILYVRYTFIRPPGFVVVVGHLLGSIFFSGKSNGIYFGISGSVNVQFAVFQRVCIGSLVPSLYSPTVVGWNHPIHFDVITYLNGYDHREPAGTQP